METIAIANLFVFLIVFSLCTIIGLDLKKWFNWLFVLYGFISGFWIGFPGGSVSLGFQVGAIFALMIISGSIMRRYFRQQYSRETAEDWLAKYGKEKQFSLLARIIEKMLGK